MRSLVSRGMVLASGESFNTKETVVGDSPTWAASCFKLIDRGCGVRSFLPAVRALFFRGIRRSFAHRIFQIKPQAGNHSTFRPAQPGNDLTHFGNSAMLQTA